MDKWNSLTVYAASNDNNAIVRIKTVRAKKCNSLSLSFIEQCWNSLMLYLKTLQPRTNNRGGKKGIATIITENELKSSRVGKMFLIFFCFPFVWMKQKKMRQQWDKIKSAFVWFIRNNAILFAFIEQFFPPFNSKTLS